MTFTIGQKIQAPAPFTGTATITGFHQHYSRNTGRIFLAVDYLLEDGKKSWDSIEKLERALMFQQ